MINWNHIDTVLLDMDGTLLDLHFDNHFWVEYLPQRYAEHHGQSIEWAKAEIYPLMKEKQGSWTGIAWISGPGNWTCRSSSSSVKWLT